MAPPNPVKCSSPGCTYETPAGCPNWDLITKQLELHAATVHPPSVGATGQQRLTHNAKLESLPRPEFSFNMTEAKWQFTQMQWDAYIAQTPASDEQKVQQLRAACTQNYIEQD